MNESRWNMIICGSVLVASSVYLRPPSCSSCSPMSVSVSVCASIKRCRPYSVCVPIACVFDVNVAVGLVDVAIVVNVAVGLVDVDVLDDVVVCLVESGV